MPELTTPTFTYLRYPPTYLPSPVAVGEVVSLPSVPACLIHAVGLGTEIKAKFSPKYFFARLVFIFGGMPFLSNLWTGMHFFNHLRCQNIILQKCMPLDDRAMQLTPNIITIVHNFATATLLAARHRSVSFDWLK
eukprot:scaffold9749_cov148-Skeletonema_menzelii.AAC.1